MKKITFLKNFLLALIPSHYLIDDDKSKKNHAILLTITTTKINLPLERETKENEKTRKGKIQEQTFGGEG